MVSGMSNALFFGIIVGGLVVLAGVAALIYYCKRLVFFHNHANMSKWFRPHSYPTLYS